MWRVQTNLSSFRYRVKGQQGVEKLTKNYIMLIPIVYTARSMGTLLVILCSASSFFPKEMRQRTIQNAHIIRRLVAGVPVSGSSVR